MIQYTHWIPGGVEKWLRQRTHGSIPIESNIASIYEGIIFIHISEGLDVSENSKKLTIELKV